MSIAGIEDFRPRVHMPKLILIPTSPTYEGYRDVRSLLNTRDNEFIAAESGYWGSFELNPTNHITAEIRLKTYKNFNLRTGIPND